MSIIDLIFKTNYTTEQLNEIHKSLFFKYESLRSRKEALSGEARTPCHVYMGTDDQELLKKRIRALDLDIRTLELELEKIRHESSPKAISQIVQEHHINF